MKGKIIGGSAVAIALSTGLIATSEGLKTKPYFDIVGVQTVCYGETNVEMIEYSKADCLDMLNDRVPEYYKQAMAYIEYDIPATMAASVTSFTYNVGVGAFSRSTMLKKINMGDLWGACDEFDRWVYAGGMWVKGLANRREAEKRMCVAELQGRA